MNGYTCVMCGGRLQHEGPMEGDNHREKYTADVWRCEKCKRWIDGQVLYALTHNPPKAEQHGLVNKTR